MTRDSAVAQSAACAACHAPIPAATLHRSGAEAPCPACGSIVRIWRVRVEDAVTARERLGAKLTRNSLPSRKKVRIELQTGDEIRRDGKGWVTKHRLVDRDTDRYIEHVVDAETGALICDQDEPLSQHRGHGSAKINREKK